MSLLLALGLAGALAQSVAAPAGAVSGRVLEEGSRAPVAGAQVMLLPAPRGPGHFAFPDRPPSAVTDQDGRYEFEGVDAGRYRITVHKPGFALPDGSEMPVLELEAGERRGDVIVTLQKGAVIMGRVLDEAGEPLIDARVLAMRRPPVPPGAGSAPQDFLVPAGPGAQTNDLGEFRLFSLPPGEYFVQAMPGHQFHSLPAPRTTTMLPTYFPGTTDSSGAQPISVGAGQTSGEIVIRMISAPAFQVSGVVRDEAGRPVVNAMVRLIVDEPTARRTFMMGPESDSRTDASGKFTINNVTSGTYTLLAAAPVVLSGPAQRQGAPLTGGGNSMSWGFSSGMVSGTIGGGVMTETTNGTTIEYRDDTATRLRVTVNDASVSGLELIVRPPAR